MHTQECSNVFSSGGGESLALECGVPFLGRVPLDPRLAQCLEEGRSFGSSYPGTPTQAAMENIVQRLLLGSKEVTMLADKDTTSHGGDT